MKIIGTQISKIWKWIVRAGVPISRVWKSIVGARIPIIADLRPASWPNWREAFKEVFVILFFSLMPLWLGLLIVNLLTIASGAYEFITNFASSSDLGILSASLLGPMLYMMFREDQDRTGDRIAPGQLQPIDFRAPWLTDATQLFWDRQVFSGELHPKSNVKAFEAAFFRHEIYKLLGCTVEQGRAIVLATHKDYCERMLPTRMEQLKDLRALLAA